MSYIIVTQEMDIPYAVRACPTSNSFQLIPLDSDVAVNKIYSHPHRAGAQQILSWINKNDPTLTSQNLSIQDEARFRK
jgi:hypothetical protein